MRLAQPLASLSFWRQPTALLGLPLLLLVACAGSGNAPRVGGDTTALAASVGSAPPPSPSGVTKAPAALSTGWLSAAKPDLRSLTVVVRANPPPALQSKYRELAARYRPLGPLFVGSAEEAFGSGFVMVWRDPAGVAQPRVFVVTNRHVVGLASQVRVMVGGSATPVAAQVAYVDDRYDLAVLALDPAAQAAAPSLDSGFALADAQARDQDSVVASGYPGIDGKPSYQVTRGFVSNERFELDEAGGVDLYIQHTAPIDPGSSGGPLMTPDGKVLGVNTLKIRHRENVGLAVPASIVAGVLAHVAQRKSPLDAAPPSEQALAACEQLLQQLRSSSPSSLIIARALGAELVAEHGLASLPSLPEDADWPGRFLDDPTEVFARAIAFRLAAEAASKAGADAPASCSPEPADAGGAVAFKVQLKGGSRRLSFGLEQGRWKLTRGSFAPSRGRSILDGLEPRRSAPKKWKPSF
jgi:serine protease Do